MGEQFVLLVEGQQFPLDGIRRQTSVDLIEVHADALVNMWLDHVTFFDGFVFKQHIF